MDTKVEQVCNLFDKGTQNADFPSIETAAKYTRVLLTNYAENLSDDQKKRLNASRTKASKLVKEKKDELALVLNEKQSNMQRNKAYAAVSIRTMKE